MDQPGCIWSETVRIDGVRRCSTQGHSGTPLYPTCTLYYLDMSTQENAPLFRIPNDLLLTPYSSDLSDVLSESEIDSLGTGWTRLILVMMWEESKGQSSKWSSYLRATLIVHVLTGDD